MPTIARPPRNAPEARRRLQEFMSGHSERAKELEAARAQLDSELLIAIRSAAAEGLTQEQIAAVVGLSRARVSQLLRQA